MAICLCGKTKCRGAFLGYSGNDALQSILHEKHGPMERLASICYSSSCWDSRKDDDDDVKNETKRRKKTVVTTKPLSSCTEGISLRFRSLLREHGMDECVLNGLPKWLLHFTASALEFSDLEKKLLPSKLAQWLKMTRGIYRKASGLPESLPDLEEKIQVKKEKEDSYKEAIGVQQQRITCLSASLDMSRHVILEDIAAATKDGSSSDVTLKSMPPPIVPLCSDEIISLLWTANFSVAKRLVWILETECAVVRSSVRVLEPCGTHSLSLISV